MDGLVASNQRRDLRIPFSSNVRFSTDQFNWHLGRAQNISKSGIFVATEKMLKAGTRIYLNFSLKTNFQNIKAIGKVVRMAIAEEKAIGEGSGMGVRFSLLPSEELMVRSVIRGVVDNSVPVRSSSLQQTAKNKLCKERATNPLAASLKWWLKEVVTKTFSSHYLIVELVLLVVMISVFVAFL